MIENIHYLENCDVIVDKRHKAASDDFLSLMTSLLDIAKWFGVPTKNEGFTLIWCILLFISVLVIELVAILRIFRAILGIAVDITGSRTIISRFSGSIFYGNALISTLLLWKLKHEWKKTYVFWKTTEITTGIYNQRKNCRTTLVLIIGFVSTFSLLEHILSMISATGFGYTFPEYFHKYIITSHGFLIRPEEYTLSIAIPIFIASKTATILWNYQDLVIILFGFGLSSRYKNLNAYVKVMIKQLPSEEVKKKTSSYIVFREWRILRQSFAQQATLVRKVDKLLRGLIPLSNLNNLYFICLQLFLGVGKAASIVDKLYYMLSFGWLCARAVAVVLMAANVNFHSKRALYYLDLCPQKDYNIEVQRLIKQLNKDFVALSGFGFFYLDRKVLLKVAAAVLTYELLLLEYDG